MHVRRALLLLASKEVVEIISNRGAYIASPSEKQARDVFEARQALEPSVVKLAVERASAADIVRLEKHLAKEHAAHDGDNRHDAIRLSGAFHILLAEIAGNDVMTRTVTELVARSSLIISVYGAPGASSCRDDDHTALIDAFKKRKSDLAQHLMSAHLQKILEQINLEVTTEDQVDLVSMFSN
jgi:DNA-binding GntR family transcriptional regulator